MARGSQAGLQQGAVARLLPRMLLRGRPGSGTMRPLQRATPRATLPPYFSGNLPMKFEHLVEINDPMNPLLDTLTREQLWHGLVLRAEQPKLFIPHLDTCEILERDAGIMRRRLTFGPLVIEDKVTLTPLQEVHYDVPAQGDIAASTLRMVIEAPTSAMLLVRFCYDDGMGEHVDQANAMYDEFKKSAYEEADIDTVRILRQLAGQGKLATTLLN
jgi:hypothetical protein